MRHIGSLVCICLLLFCLKANSHHLHGAKSDDDGDDGHETPIMDADAHEGMINLPFSSNDC